MPPIVRGLDTIRSDWLQKALTKLEIRIIMAKKYNTLEPGEGPWLILGVSAQADDNQIRTAYLRKVKEYPPDRAPEQFERIRDAYEALRAPQQRSKRMLFSVNPQANLVSLLQQGAQARRFVGPDPWWAVLNERK